jgi:hypothetical protein
MSSVDSHDNNSLSGLKPPSPRFAKYLDDMLDAHKKPSPTDDDDKHDDTTFFRDTSTPGFFCEACNRGHCCGQNCGSTSPQSGKNIKNPRVPVSETIQEAARLLQSAKDRHSDATTKVILTYVIGTLQKLK